MKKDREVVKVLSVSIQR